MKILLLDNYDSFTYNLMHLIEKISDTEVEVKRNDKITLAEIESFNKIVLSPGPGLPKNAGIMPELLKKYSSSKSIFGVCLGLQAIGECFGAKLKNLSTVYHGVTTPVNVNTGSNLFNACPKRFLVGRYHSWAINEITLPEDLEIISTDDDGNIMALKHKRYKVSGVQFHPESILSEYGETILKNWLYEE